MPGDSEKQDEDMSELFSEASSPIKRATPAKGRDPAAVDTPDSEESSFGTRDGDSSIDVPVAATKHEIPKPPRLPDIAAMERRHSSASIERPQSVAAKARPPRPSSAVLVGVARAGVKRAASGKMDMSKVLSYLKRNRYDDRGDLVFCLCVWCGVYSENVRVSVCEIRTSKFSKLSLFFLLCIFLSACHFV